MTRSLTEEIIGILWLILAVLLISIHAHWIFLVIPIFQGISSEIAAIYFAAKEGKE